MRLAILAGPAVYLLIGAACMGAMAYAMIADPDQAYQSYLFAYLFWLGISLGGFGTRMIWHLSGGAWGEFIYEPLVAAGRLLPFMALLFVPICVALPRLFLWAQEAPAHADLIAKKQWYLNAAVFYWRAGGYFLLWSAGPFLLDRSRTARWRRRFSAVGLIIFAFTTYGASVDWIMSLNLVFSSSIFGLIVASGALLTGTAMAIIAAYFLNRRDQRGNEWLACRFHDLGGLLLMFLLAWNYAGVSQFVTIWIADLPRETAWYLPRLETSWFDWGAFMVAINLVVPVALLLSRGLKRSPPLLTAVAGLVLLAQLMFSFWQVAPNLRTPGFSFYWTDGLAVGAVGGLWLGFYFWQLRHSSRHADPAKVSGYA